MNLSLLIKQRHCEMGHFLKTRPPFDKAASLSQELQGVWHCVSVLRQRGCRHPRSELRNAGGMYQQPKAGALPCAGRRRSNWHVNTAMVAEGSTHQTNQAKRVGSRKHALH